MNKRAVIDLLRESDVQTSLTVSTEAFTTALQSLEVPLEEENWTQLFAIYDKKNDGVINYDDFLSEQKYIHAVSGVAFDWDF